MNPHAPILKGTLTFDVEIREDARLQGYVIRASFTEPNSGGRRGGAQRIAGYAELATATFPLVRVLVYNEIAPEIERLTGRYAERGTLTLPRGWDSIDGPARRGEMAP